MKEKEICRFVRSFSSLGHLQAEGKMLYALWQEGPQNWRICLEYRQKTGVRTDSCVLGPLNRLAAVQLLQCLYENAVPAGELAGRAARADAKILMERRRERNGRNRLPVART